MTEKKYELIKPWLDKKGLNIDCKTLGELEAELRVFHDEKEVMLYMDEASLFFDAQRRTEVAKGLLSVILNEDDKGSHVLEETLRTVVGYAIAHASDVREDLKHFTKYTIEAAMSVGNEEGLKGRKEPQGGTIVLPIVTGKIKS